MNERTVNSRPGRTWHQQITKVTEVHDRERRIVSEQNPGNVLKYAYLWIYIAQCESFALRKHSNKSAHKHLVKQDSLLFVLQQRLLPTFCRPTLPGKYGHCLPGNRNIRLRWGCAWKKQKWFRENIISLFGLSVIEKANFLKWCFVPSKCNPACEYVITATHWATHHNASRRFLSH